MICQICKEDHRCLFNHIGKHGLSTKDYKIKYNLPLKKALADDDWVQRMRDIGHERKSTTKGKAHLEMLEQKGRDYTAKLKSGDIPYQARRRKEWPECSRVKVDALSKKKSTNSELVCIVKKEWANGVGVMRLSISSTLAKEWVDIGILPKRARIKRLSDKP